MRPCDLLDGSPPHLGLPAAEGSLRRSAGVRGFEYTYSKRQPPFGPHESGLSGVRTLREVRT